MNNISKIFSLFLIPIIYCDAPFKYQVSFQDPATPVMSSIIFLHDYIWNFLIFIIIFVTWMLCRILILFSEHPSRKIIPIVHNTALEVVWTLSPAGILALIAGNSISHLYSAEEYFTPAFDVMIVGNQWYWTYEMMAFDSKVVLESRGIEVDKLVLGELRLLEVDYPLVLPVNTTVRLLVTANDVLHSWAVPSLGVKMDACPGRLNEVNVYIEREGTFRGQCSEICGKGHAAMPIVVQAVSIEEYLVYLHFLTIISKD